MIVRIWQGKALESNAELYRRYFAEDIVPRLKAVKGFCGYEVLERLERGHVEFLIITRWENMDAIRAFAGVMPDKAVLEHEARTLLEQYDEYVTHYIRVMEEKE